MSYLRNTKVRDVEGDESLEFFCRVILGPSVHKIGVLVDFSKRGSSPTFIRVLYLNKFLI